MKRIVNNLVYKLERKVLKTDTSKGFGGFFKRIIEQF
jgi:flagellar biosynthesis protein FlhG